MNFSEYYILMKTALKISCVISLLMLSYLCYGFVIDKLDYLHYEYVEVRELFRGETNYKLQICKDGAVVSDLIGRFDILPSFEVKEGRTNLVFIFVPSYGIQDGQYEVRGYSNDVLLLSTNIYFLSRMQAKLNEPITALNFEENYNITNLLKNFSTLGFVIGGKDNYEKVSTSIRHLLSELKCNTFIILAAQTSGLVNKKELWLNSTLNNTKILYYLKNSGIQTGAYVMAFLTLGLDKGDVPGYFPNLVFRNGKLQENYKYTSITSRKRIEDIKNVLVRLGKEDYIDFLGLDFIRVGDYGGYELSKDFFFDVLVKIPEYSNLREEFRKWNFGDIEKFARFLKTNSNANLLFKWYQARRVSLIIKEIKDHLRENGINKPLITFMLGWNGGREHGQDLFMFRDAGSDYAFYMLYEIYSDNMFRKMGNYYLTKIYNRDSNIVFGNIVDAKLNRDGESPLKVFSRRLWDFSVSYSYFAPNGLFFHDLHRLLRGRLGNFSVKDWIEEIRDLRYAIEELKIKEGGNNFSSYESVSN